MLSEPSAGTRIRRHPDPPAGYIRAASRPVTRINATTTKPTRAPITKLRTSESWSSLCRSLSRLPRSLAIQDCRCLLSIVSCVEQKRRDTTCLAGTACGQKSEAPPVLVSPDPTVHYRVLGAVPDENGAPEEALGRCRRTASATARTRRERRCRRRRYAAHRRAC